MDHKDIGEEEHDHRNGKDRKIGNNVSEPAAKGVRARKDVLKQDEGGENNLNNDSDVGLEELEDKFKIGIDNRKNNNYPEEDTKARNSQNQISYEADSRGGIRQNGNKAWGDKKE